jgi:hypothetical protein
MGTVSFDGQFPGMRKPQDFIVYPMQAGDSVAQIKIQSDKRSGFISLVSGAVSLYPGQYFVGAIKQIGALPQADLLILKANVLASAGPSVGGVVKCDNSRAASVFGE